MNRREFLNASLAAAAGLMLSSARGAEPAPAPASPPRPQPRIPRWRGFNLQGYVPGSRGLKFPESDFELMAG